ncbi:HISTONE-LIKE TRANSCRIPTION FACTOR CCAAT-RELATED [Salix koriyanagi]|uniref:HISTONE-LIKE TRANSCRIPTION FACTOR CCAAT-RELATED n=1 Tax=Salix koriyanagi TaxID=2511006 RepID=A0A9Q0PVJ8_9ROSI|nr:HISTONE-LIKE TRANSCRIPTION FACTOR CCAAT-RELATED [Salix koriyanagi]
MQAAVEEEEVEDEGRGRGRGARNIERESSSRDLDPESCTTAQPSIENNSDPGLVMDNGSESKESVKENNRVSDTTNQPERNFDLNAEVNDNEGAKAAAAAAAAAAATATATTTTTSSAPGSSAETAAAETNHEEYPGWSLSEMDKMAIDPLQLAQLGKGLDEEEDYDEEG